MKQNQVGYGTRCVGLAGLVPLNLIFEPQRPEDSCLGNWGENFHALLSMYTRAAKLSVSLVYFYRGIAAFAFAQRGVSTVAQFPNQLGICPRLVV